jgi:hypothetical protein
MQFSRGPRRFRPAGSISFPSSWASAFSAIFVPSRTSLPAPTISLWHCSLGLIITASETSCSRAAAEGFECNRDVSPIDRLGQIYLMNPSRIDGAILLAALGSPTNEVLLLHASSSRVDRIHVRSEILAIGPLALVGA